MPALTPAKPTPAVVLTDDQDEFDALPRPTRRDIMRKLKWMGRLDTAKRGMKKKIASQAASVLGVSLGSIHRYLHGFRLEGWRGLRDERLRAGPVPPEVRRKAERRARKRRRKFAGGEVRPSEVALASARAALVRMMEAGEEMEHALAELTRRMETADSETVADLADLSERTKRLVTKSPRRATRHNPGGIDDLISC